MRQLVLLGEAETKRTIYFTKACQTLGVQVERQTLAEYDAGLAAPAMIKIDPPSFASWELERQAEFLASYRLELERLSASGQVFFNEPLAIWTALDKRRCKEMLQSQGLPVTEMWPESITTADELRALIAWRHWPGAFVKPRFGSAAAGILAYRFAPKSGREVLYTCTAIQDKRLVNTKTLRRLEDRAEIAQLLEQILAGETVVERWYPKAQFQGRAYDLRAVVQFGQLDFLLARASKGPITNLQLNNGAVPVSQLQLAPETLAEIETVCLQALAVLPGLRYAGIDVLLEERTRKPYIVEVNGQGDLLYQDIFAENRIYARQITYYMQKMGGKAWI